jgi:hypothetical protein
MFERDDFVGLFVLAGGTTSSNGRSGARCVVARKPG